MEKASIFMKLLQESVVIYNRSAMGICYLHSGSDNLFELKSFRKVLQFTIDLQWESVICTAAATQRAKSVVIY